VQNGNRTGGIMYLSPDIHPINPAKSAVDKSAAQLAIIQIQLHIESMQDQRKNLEYRPSKRLVISGWLKIILILLGSIFIIISIVDFRTRVGFILFLLGIAMFIIRYFIGTA